MKAKILKSDADEVVVLAWDGEDSDGTRAITISVEDLPEAANSDGVFDLAEDVMATGTPYGVSAEQLADMLPLQDILQNLQRKGVYTLEDMRSQPDLVARVIMAYSARMLEAI